MLEQLIVPILIGKHRIESIIDWDGSTINWNESLFSMILDVPID
jgi:hypothetical protein